ncbi:hypothetical protein F0P96_12975 [Hymenobacter busanensis]|uniref:Uncharacterized protein n=1 Tax=Hymenobacter busanensis TaxID=2607656 RepID=A0A7L4ZWB0_9BACT|nr:type IIL restriction-modification enzyme MmeI [Hymenobacter busanensis]KAA9332380.1 hypothetical protein F0P96_12975 [Hymenobacter busanensis]QHJ07283.1 hypothetical protein GUY19_08300 [Hymenobacter busanensis]
MFGINRRLAGFLRGAGEKALRQAGLHRPVLEGHPAGGAQKPGQRPGPRLPAGHRLLPRPAELRAAQYLLVSDFTRFRLYAPEGGQQDDFPLEELHQHLHRFAFLTGYQKHQYAAEAPAAFPTELSRLEFLFGKYRQLAAPLLPRRQSPPKPAKAGPRRKAPASSQASAVAAAATAVAKKTNEFGAAANWLASEATAAATAPTRAATAATQLANKTNEFGSDPNSFVLLGSQLA